MKHKWHKEIKAWADGAEVEMRWTNGEIHDEWRAVHNGFNWNSDLAEFRIKPQPSGCLACVTCGQLIEQNQPKELQYMYVYMNRAVDPSNYILRKSEQENGIYIGKIKLEVDDV